MASRRVHIANISLSLTLILALLLVAVAFFTVPTGGSSSSSSSSLSSSSKYQRQQRLRDPRPLAHWHLQNRRRQPFRQPHPRTHPKEQRQHQDVGKFVFQNRHQPLPKAGEQAEERASVSVTGPMNNHNVRGKSWPQLVGLDAEEAKKKILEEHPNFQVQVLPAGGGMMTMDYNLRRVRIFKDADQKVTRPPKLG